MSSQSQFIAHLTLEDLAKREFRDDGTGKSTLMLQVAAEARSKGYEGICIPLTNEKWKSRWRDLCLLPSEDVMDNRQEMEKKGEEWRANPGFDLDEVTITQLEESEGVVGITSDLLDLDSSDDWVRNDSEIALLQELAYASYLGVRTVILPAPRNRAFIASYARAVNAALKANPYIILSVRIPIYDPQMIQLSSGTPGTVTGASLKFVDDQPSIATWEMWDAIRTICDYDPRLTLTLDMTPPLPAELEVLYQWVAEPTRYLFLPASAFISNAKGYPVLTKGTQSFIRDIMKIQPHVILSGTFSGRHSKGGEAAYSQYVRHLEKTSPYIKAANTTGTVENFAHGYQDYLQKPLQPLMDNLQSMTYHTFEQDPVKYRNYEEAVFRALSEWPKPGKIIICVAGAGRGPLVVRCLTAAVRTGKEVLVYALEKNPSAFVTLQSKLRREWGDKVKLLFGDMRTAPVPERVDILVSELLGSFGDNELSPECLDGAMRFLKDDGISIPASYTAYLAPLSSSKLYNETRVTREEKEVETPYVVMFQAVNILSGDGGGIRGVCGPRVQECWEFEHPRRDAVLNEQGLPPTNSHNARSAKLTFHIPHAGVLHGLAGYFEAVLYGNIGLSIHPDRMQKISKDMLSWFPIYFPFKEPLYLPSNSELQVSMWRLTSDRQVWYEWCAEAFLPLPGTSVLPEKPKALANTEDDTSQLLAPLATPTIIHSPLADADDSTSAFTSEKISLGCPPDEPGSEGASSRIGLVKIGQTSLHNPGGRSSWIGL